MKKIKYTWEEFDIDINKTAEWIVEHHSDIKAIYGIPLGGLPFMVALKNNLQTRNIMVDVYFSIQEIRDTNVSYKKILFVDDIADTGKTLMNVFKIYYGNNDVIITLFKKPQSIINPHFACRVCKNDDWIIFPWENEEKELIRDGTVIS